MQLAILAIVAAVLAFIIMNARAQRKRDADSAPDDGMHTTRIGDRLRRLNDNKRRYAVMTRALLEETPDDTLLEAVLSNLWAKMQPDLSDALEVMAWQSPQRQRLYALYAVTGGVKQDGMADFLRSPDASLLPTALDTLAALDMPGSAQILREATSAEDADVYKDPYLETFEGEGGKAKLAAYVRANPEGFVDPAQATDADDEVGDTP